jgi:hypothetical protein
MTDQLKVPAFGVLQGSTRYIALSFRRLAEQSPTKCRSWNRSLLTATRCLPSASDSSVVTLSLL